MIQLELPHLHCYRCGNTWTPRLRGVRICPRCKSAHWDEPRLRIPTGGGGLGIREVLLPHRRAIDRLARKHGAREIRVFGSVARQAASTTSDVDLLVDFDPGVTGRSPLRSLDFAADLERLLHRHVDVVTEESLHWFVQPQVVVEAVPL